MSQIPFSAPSEIVVQPFVREAAAEFFGSEAGRTLLEALSALRPDILGKGPIDQVALRSAEVKGYEDVFRNLRSILFPAKFSETPAAAENYPSLDDDSKWGQQ